MDKSTKFARFYNLSLRYLSFRPRSEKEMLDYLNKKKLDEEEIKKIMNKLNEYDFIDDRKFAKFWVDSRLRAKNKPLWLIEQELKQKGVARDIVEEVLPQKEDKSDIDLKSAKQLAEKKLNFYRNLDPKKRREKVTGYLLRKGFSWDTIKKTLK